MPDAGHDTYEALRDGLLQDLLAVRLLVSEARDALPVSADALRDVLMSAGQVLDADITAVRAWMEQIRSAA